MKNNHSCKNLQPAEIHKYECEYCNKEFTRIDNLKVHIDKRCKQKNLINENAELKKELEQLKNEISDIKLIIYNNRDKVSKELFQNLQIII